MGALGPMTNSFAPWATEPPDRFGSTSRRGTGLAYDCRPHWVPTN
jgi:hypothetical protein